MTDKLEEVTYYGLYCWQCSTRSRIPQRANALRDILKKRDMKILGQPSRISRNSGLISNTCANLPRIVPAEKANTDRRTVKSTVTVREKE